MHIHNVLIGVRDRRYTIQEAEQLLNEIINRQVAERFQERKAEQAWGEGADRQAGAFDDGELLEAARQELGYQ